MPIFQQNKKVIVKKYNFKNLKMIPFIQSYEEGEFSDFNGSRVIAFNFKGIVIKK